MEMVRNYKRTSNMYFINRVFCKR